MIYYCEVCYKTVESGYKKRHSNTKSHRFMASSIVNTVKDPKLNEIKKIFEKYVKEYSKKLIFFYIICKWKLHFTNGYTSYIGANTEYRRNDLSNCEPCAMLEKYLFSESEYLYNTDRLELNYISEMKITSTSDFRFMKYNHYIDIPKQTVE